jgi:hypothetical protein
MHTHTHIYIYTQCTRGGWDEILMYIKLKRQEGKKCNVCKWWSRNSRCEHLKIKFDYGENSLWQRNSRKTNKKKEKFSLSYNCQQSWNPKQAITLKYLITYSNLRK